MRLFIFVFFFLFFSPFRGSAQPKSFHCANGDSVDSSKTIYTYFLSYNGYTPKGVNVGYIFYPTNQKKINEKLLEYAAKCVTEMNSEIYFVGIINIILTDTHHPQKKRIKKNG